MPGLGEELDGQRLDLRTGLRIGTGFGLLLAGAAVVGLGLLDLVPVLASNLGVGEAIATRLGVVVAGSVVVAVLAAVGSRIPGPEGRWPLDAGIGLSMVAVLGAGATATPTTGSLPGLPPLVWTVYGSGVLLAFAGALAGAIAPAVAPDGIERESIAYRREDPRVTPADGGEEDDDLDFLLDDDE